MIDALIVGIGTAVSTTVLKLWLQENPLLEGAANSIVSILSGRFKETLKRNSIERQFRGIADLAASSIKQLVDKEAPNSQEKDIIRICNAASETIANVELTIEIILEHSINSEKLLNFFLNKTGADGANPILAGKVEGSDYLYSDNDRILYRRILRHGCELITDFAHNLPGYQENIDKEFLRRFDEMAGRITSEFENAIKGKADSFESKYRTACSRNFDYLELFGADLDESSRKYSLSEAYIALSVASYISSEGSLIEELKGKTIDEQLAIISDDTFDPELASVEHLSVSECLAKHPKLLISGIAGSGKTTLIQWYLVNAARNELPNDLEWLRGRIPFVVKLRNYTERALPNLEELPATVSSGLGQVPESWVTNHFDSGNAIFLVDGLDEIDKDRREEVGRWLSDIVADRDIRVVLTSRPHATSLLWLDHFGFSHASL